MNAAAQAEIVRLRAENARLGADNAQLAVIAHGELADLRSIERRVKLDDRPWSGKWCLRFEVVVLGAMAALMAATGAPKYETNSNHDRGRAPQKPTPRRVDKAAAGAPGTWGAWLKSEMCWEMEAAGQWDPPQFTGQCTGQTACQGLTASCVNDDSTSDAYGYTRRQRACGSYDDEDFTASKQCCACGGGLYGGSFGTDCSILTMRERRFDH